jgi:hypothetical protein
MKWLDAISTCHKARAALGRWLRRRLLEAAGRDFEARHALFAGDGGHGAGANGSDEGL